MITDEQYEKLTKTINELNSRVANLEHYTLSAVNVLTDLMDNAMDGTLTDKEREMLVNQLFEASNNLSSMFFETAKALNGGFSNPPPASLENNKHLH